MSQLTVGAVADVRFGGLQGLSLEGLDHGFVVVSGRNESGKSTLAEFIAWMIAGPAGDAATASRYGDKDSVVGGRLLGTLGAEPLDLAGSFTILARGAPSDSPNKGQRAPRTGTLGAVGLDGAQFLARLGGLTPAAYDLLYRIGSESAHLLGSEEDLVELFAKYATGSIASSVNPRTVIDGLKSDISRTKANLNQLAGNSGTRADAKRRLDEALARPGRIRDIEGEMVTLETERTAVGESISAEAEKLGDLRTAIAVVGRDEVARAAEKALADAPTLPADVAAVADDLDTIAELAGSLASARDEVAASESAVTAACRAVGADARTLAEHTLTNADTRVFLDAASAIGAKRTALENAELARTQHTEALRAARDHAKTCLSQGSLEPDVILRRILDVDKVAQLGNPAYAADQAAREVGQRERAVDAARLEGVDRPEEPVVSPNQSAMRRLLPALLGVLGAFLGGLKHPAVSAVAGVVGFLVGNYVVSRRGAAVTVSPRGDNDPVAAATALLDAARLDLAGKLATLNESLTALGLPSADSGTAVAYVGDLERALRALAEVRRLESLSEGLDAAVETCRTGLQVAETTYGRLFDQRGLPKVAETGIAAWLDVYADAIRMAVTHAELVRRHDETENDLAVRTRGVARLSDGSPPTVVAVRAQEYAKVRDELARLAKDASDRRNDADIAMGGRSQVRELLRSGNKEMLEADVRSTESTITTLEERRSAIDESLGALRSELRQKSEGELVADLTEELGRIDDDIDELAREYVVLVAALESIEKVVGEYELRNQGPVINEAQRLILSVDPEFGALYVDRATGDAQLMVDRAGRRIPVRRLSTGARALVYFALRLAFQTVDSQGRPVALPLICDDPLVTVDDRRVEPLMRLLQRVSQERQVIFLTCHERERAIAARIGARIIELP